MGTLFWIIVISCALYFFPWIVAGIVLIVAVLFITALIALLTKDRRDMKRRESERATVRPCEFTFPEKRQMSAAELERAREQSAITQKWAKIRKEEQEAKARAAAEERRARAERIAKYSQIARKAAVDGDTEDSDCWRCLVEIERNQKTNRNRF